MIREKGGLNQREAPRKKNGRRPTKKNAPKNFKKPPPKYLTISPHCGIIYSQAERCICGVLPKGCYTPACTLEKVSMPAALKHNILSAAGRPQKRRVYET